MNPLMQAMGGSPLGNFQAMMGQIGQLKQMFSGDPKAAIQMLSQRNPQFAQFMRDNQGKSPEQIAKEYGLDWAQIQQYMK